MKDAPQFVATLYKKVLELKTAKLMSASFTSAGTKKRVLEPETEGPSNGETGEKPPGQRVCGCVHVLVRVGGCVCVGVYVCQWGWRVCVCEGVVHVY